MSDKRPDILDKNFLIKRVGDDLYLPCVKPISCKAPSHLPKTTYLLCRTAKFDPGSGLLSLNSPTDYGKYDESGYQLSIQANSALILSFNVQAFLILWGTLNSADLSPKYDWRDHISNADWIPAPQKRSANMGHTNGARPNPPSPPPFSINEKCMITIEDLVFGDGTISFTRFIHFRLGDVTFEIPYPGSRKEFDAIKEYFEKVIHSKTIECEITVEAVGPNIQSKSARFCQKNLFDNEMIEKVEDYFIRSKILDSDDDISLVEENLKALISLNEEDRKLDRLLEKLQKFKKSKHYYHLRHLSSLHNANAFRLRMTGKPVSFIFVIKGALDYHLIWETYETEEATYIWKLAGRDAKDRQMEMSDLLEKIKWLRDKNKRTYIQSNPPNFRRIEHDYSQKDGGLEKWKLILSETIT
jgi:hypothetical protein